MKYNKKGLNEKRSNAYLKRIWIAWEYHRRTIELSRFFDCDLKILHSNRSRYVKHPIFLLKTWKIIHFSRPIVLIVQNPSIVLSIFVCIIRNIYRYRLIVDAHNAGLLPDRRFIKAFGWIYKLIQRVADVTIVTNKKLAEIVLKNGGSPQILPDKIPKIMATEKIGLKGKYNIVFICTFGKDEPYLEVIKAVHLLENENINICIYVTGSLENVKNEIIDNAPSNLIFTGFLSEYDYYRLLSSSNLSIDLTNRENC